MGLFGGLFKGIAKVAGAGLSVLTHGASDQVLKVLKGRGAVKQVVNTPVTTQQQALVMKALPPNQRAGLSSTESVLRPIQARYSHREGGITGSVRKKMPGRAKVSSGVQDSPDITAYRVDPETGEYDGYGWSESRQKYVKLANGSSRPAKARSAPKRAPAASKKKTARSVPRGGLDLKRISQMWAAQGKPGAWLDFIKANSNVRKS